MDVYPKSFTIKAQKHSKGGLKFVLDDQTSDYVELLDKANVPAMGIMVLRYLAIGFYKCINDINPKYLNVIFTTKECR